MKAILIASLVAGLATAAMADEAPTHRRIERLPNGHVLVIFDVPVCSEISDWLPAGQPAPPMPIEADGILTVDYIGAPQFRRTGSDGACAGGIGFTEIIAVNYLIVR